MKTVMILFGGRSTEHEVSCMSALNVLKSVDREKWHVLPVGITRSGRWLLSDEEALENDTWRRTGADVELSLDPEKPGLRVREGAERFIPVDAAWPVLHGKFGEDGTIQGLFEMAGIPYVGCGVLASAVSMDKFFTKIIADAAGIRQARFVGIYERELERPEAAADRVEAELSYPVFVKPSNAGSSCGVSKAADRAALVEALKKAAEVDGKILVEEYIPGREIECAVLESGGEIFVSGVGEILAAAEFYDYDAKYHSTESKTVLDPDLPARTIEEIRRAAAKVFSAVDGKGLSRVDFFVKEDGTVIFNEINTMPGFTAISMFPMLWEARGISKTELAARLLESAMH